MCVWSRNVMISVCIWRESAKRHGHPWKTPTLCDFCKNFNTAVFWIVVLVSVGFRQTKQPRWSFQLWRNQSYVLSVSCQKQKGGLLILTIVFTSSLTFFILGQKKGCRIWVKGKSHTALAVPLVLWSSYFNLVIEWNVEQALYFFLFLRLPHSSRGCVLPKLWVERLLWVSRE